MNHIGSLSQETLRVEDIHELSWSLGKIYEQDQRY